MEKIHVLILAAGHGKRMNSDLPKVLLSLYDKPLIRYVTSAVADAGVCLRPTIIVGQKAELVKAELGNDYNFIFQNEQLGTGHAVACARPALAGRAENILVLYGDQPALKAKTIKNLTEVHLKTGATLTIATTFIPDFEDWKDVFFNFGHIVRNRRGEIERSVEMKDATDEEKKIDEVNPAYFCFKADWLWENLEKIGNNNNQKEYYLTDLIGLAKTGGGKISSIFIDPKEAIGVNTPEQLKLTEKILKSNQRVHQSAGGVVVNGRGEILITNQQGISWSLPKGHVDLGENLLETAMREIKEETGLGELNFIRELGHYSRFKIGLDPSTEDKTKIKTIHMFLFKTSSIDKNLHPLDPENPEARWVPKDQVAQMLTHPKDKEFFLSIINQI
ncbi:hypothetical protein A3I25_00845 [Candidatus Nomurabacteria bacterium RIFCSPLOWO2_02_FULL_42_17]|uniref:Nudix hydrolase domain-containing protein n=2 Tax=Candidatus Nomuraibacteriota TaxID=1752729 RepID=A0A1F6WJZ9_9BACT|nr:MAG: Bifunctional protein GlmU [Parcubacteria group bacterium GW2011_GWA2_42_18]OGI82055.1 MAG: hypothetical protein A3B93_02460 [Candidatus Nomurabacteria bacterium RIFCSPHIGHO2_02_FULL_42_24]OGI96456.1 MAG: hypothetical protein A3I25_00845 [Candidatus Nomurabacteria bacterium RIFCSPLOWO2_02_FULL_42_17]